MNDKPRGPGPAPRAGSGPVLTVYRPMSLAMIIFITSEVPP